MILVLGISGLRGQKTERQADGAFTSVTVLQLLQLQLGVCDKKTGRSEKKDVYIYILLYYYYLFSLFSGVGRFIHLANCNCNNCNAVTRDAPLFFPGQFENIFSFFRFSYTVGKKAVTSRHDKQKSRYSHGIPTLFPRLAASRGILPCRSSCKAYPCSKRRTSNCRPAKRRADDADFTRYNDGMNPKQMGDFISQTNNAL